MNGAITSGIASRQAMKPRHEWWPFATIRGEVSAIVIM